MLEGAPLACKVKLQFIEHSNGPSENNPLAHYRALRFLLEFRPDVLVCSLWRSVPVALAYSALRPRCKLVLFLHSPITVHVLDRIFSRLILKRCDAIWADSEATLVARGIVDTSSIKRVVSFVTNVGPELDWSKALRPRFVFWGRLHPQKGLDRAIEFVQSLKDRGAAPVFEIFGPDGGAEKQLRQQITSAGLEKEVLLKGQVRPEELDRIATTNSFYLQLSREEGMAMSVVEAMQRSLVPVVTPVGEIANYCTDGENAVVVQDPDNPGPAVDKVLNLLGEESEYRVMQKAAHAQWSSKVLYRDDFCRAAIELLSAR